VLFRRWRASPLLVEVSSDHPKVALELLLLDRLTNVSDAGSDVAVRIGHLSDSSLIAVHVSETKRVSLPPGVPGPAWRSPEGAVLQRRWVVPAAPRA
jgi:hypothetical protein